MSSPPSRAIANCRLLLILYWLAMAVGSHWPRLELNAISLPFGLDKWLHFTAYTGLVWLLSMTGWLRVIPAGRLRGWCLPASFIALVYSWIDESTQYFIPGRYIDPGDVLASDLGVLLGTLLAIWTWRHLSQRAA